MKKGDLNSMQQTAADFGSQELKDEAKQAAETLQRQAESAVYTASKLAAYSLLEKALEIDQVKSYQGQFENGIANGMATIVFCGDAQGDRYEGMVKSGRLNGIGKFTKSDGTTREGIWKDNDLQNDKFQ